MDRFNNTYNNIKTILDNARRNVYYAVNCQELVLEHAENYFVIFQHLRWFRHIGALAELLLKKNKKEAKELIMDNI